MSAELLKLDLENRFPTYTFTETAIGDLFLFEAHDGPTLITKAKKMTLMDAVRLVRENLLDGATLLVTVTSAQKGALVGPVIDGFPIIVKDTGKTEIGHDASWKNPSGVTST